MTPKPEHCEWGDCEKPVEVTVSVDGEVYGFCSDAHADEFWESIREDW